MFVLKSCWNNIFAAIMHTAYIHYIPQGMVDENLKPDHLAGPKALDLNY